VLRDGSCPECGAGVVRKTAGPRPGDWIGSTLTALSEGTDPDLGPLPADAPPPPFGPAAVTRYACAVCGRSEEWVEASADLVAIRLLLPGPPKPKGVWE
jgi:hypothetical protein